MPRLSLYARERIRSLMSEGGSVKMTMDAFRAEGITPCRQTVWRFWGHYQTHGSISPLRSSGRPQKLTETVLQLIDAAMMVNDETTAKELRILLQQHGMVVSLCTVLRGRRSLGWTFRGAAYCQLIRDANKVKRLEWAREHIEDDFEDVVWTDEPLYSSKLIGATVAVRMG